MRQADIPFTEQMIPFDSFDESSSFKKTISALNPVGKVPVLVEDDLVIWDTLAIAEYLAEQFPNKTLWPQDRKARAHARSICAEMHSGFTALRSAFPMNIEAHLPTIGALVLRDRADVRRDLTRIESLFTELLNKHQGPCLFGDFSIADAYFAPVCMRIETYALPVNPVVQNYISHLRALPGIAKWIEEAKAEKQFLAFEEPYRVAR
jgi:glutathione S-transferase